jgi:ribonuclease HI
MTYAWGLGTSTNKNVETYALLQGLISVNANIVRTLIVIGDSSIIIIIMTSKKTHFDSKQAYPIERIQKMIPRF